MPELLEIAERVAGWARDGEQVEAYVSHARDTDVRVYQGEIESFSSAETQGIGVRVVSGHKQGFAYAGALDGESLRSTLDEARDNASFGTEDEFLALPEPDGVAPATLDHLWREELADFPTEDKIALAMELERATRAADPRIRGLEASDYGDAMMEAAVASSVGIRAASRRTVCSVAADAIAAEGGDTKTGYGYSVARVPADLDVAKAAADAAYRATRLLGAKQPRSTRLTVVLDPLVTSSFLGVLSSTLSGEALVKGRSLFADRLGEDVASAVVRLTEDPTNPEAYGAGQYDAEGLATRRTVLIDRGRLAAFLHNSYTGRRTGGRSNGCAARGGFKSAPGVGARALSLAPGELMQPALLAEIGDGLLVQSVNGLHSGVNPVSGDFSVGAEGMVVRGGVPAEPVREVTIASTLPRMLLDVVAVGADIEWLPGGAAGVSLVIRDVTMSGG
ncbi:MAG: peptidase family protein [Acidimicrobiales bacterium]|nr:peptidase family protein [Acidimicrobiales bacterium]